jgi:hypothetical protein
VPGADMNKSLVAVLNDNERLLVAETEPASLGALDEDAAVELHDRVRRARNKYAGQYRRAASARVPEAGGRGKARPANERAAMKTEAFEQALSLVSRRVATLARASAARLRSERISAAKAARQGTGPSARKLSPGAKAAQPRGSGAAVADQVRDRSMRTPATEKQRASTKAMGARRQARKDSR